MLQKFLFPERFPLWHPTPWDWAQFAAEYLFWGACVGLLVWTARTYARAERQRTAEGEAGFERFLTTLTNIRALFSVWSLRPRL